MNTTPRTYNGGASDHTGNERTSSESQAALQQAVRTLRAIRQRYHIDCMRNSHAGSRGVHVALGSSDMCWIGAAIEALEEAIAAATRAAVITGEKASRDCA
jgi:hypothetical protein